MGWSERVLLYCDDDDVLGVGEILAIVIRTVRPWDLEAYRYMSVRNHCPTKCFKIRPPCKNTRTGFFASDPPEFFTQMFSFKQSSDAVLLFCAAKFFHTRKPDRAVKFGKLLRGGLFEGQSGDFDHQSYHR
jgi:hypothetical protein